MVERHERNLAAQQSTEDELPKEWGPEYRRNINLINGMLDNLINGMLEGLPWKVCRRMLKSYSWARKPLTAYPYSTILASLNSLLISLAFVDLARQVNPVGTVVPGASNISAIDTEIEQIEKVMKENRSAYNKDSKMQDRYMQLLEAKERFNS
ncbi:MAG: hypothetical protein ACR5LF_00300 [Symbiopectobacterium sp.]